ncbi:MAG: YybH family protein [Thermoanaerobaculia bacterium]
MRALSCAMAALLVLGTAVGAAAGHHEEQQALMEEVTAIGDDLAQAVVANDVERMMAMYVPNAISLPNFGPRMQGIDAFRQSNAEMTAAGMRVLSFESEPTEVWQSGEQVVEIGKYEITLTMPGMPANIEDRGKYLTIYERDADGGLKIKVETWNTDLNPMAMMGGQAGQPAAPQSEDRDNPDDADPVP